MNNVQGVGPLIYVQMVMWCSKVALGHLMGLLMKNKPVDCSKQGHGRWCFPSHDSRMRQTSSGPWISYQTLYIQESRLGALLVQVHHLTYNVGQ